MTASDQKITVTVGAKRTLEYVLECLSQFNRGHDKLVLRSVGQCISKAAEVAQILGDFDVKIEQSSIHQLERDGATYTCMDITLICTSSQGVGFWIEPNQKHRNFIDFPVYHLLFDAALNSQEELHICADGFDRLLTIKRTKNKDAFTCAPGPELAALIEKKDWEKTREPLDGLINAFNRCGFLLSNRHWQQVASRLGECDDVILGLDTNILYNCAVTQQLLDSFVFLNKSGYLYAPNWVLLVIPNAVMHEIEQAANSRNSHGRLTQKGRMGYRGLQEILEIDQSKDIHGISALMVGEANPTLDTRVELRGLRKDLLQRENSEEVKLYRESAGDTTIRDQFKTFLRQISFHKGAYFLTADKTNSALAKVEGLHAIYYPHYAGNPFVKWDGDATKIVEVERPHVSYGEESLQINVPLGKLLYELAVVFQPLQICWGQTKIEVECDHRGEDLELWVDRNLKIDEDDLKELKQHYGTVGRFTLEEVQKLWKGYTDQD